MLSYIVKRGDTTIYEWRTGIQPTSVERPSDVEVKFGDEKAETTEQESAAADGGYIDFDIGGAGFSTDNVTHESNGLGSEQNVFIDSLFEDFYLKLCYIALSSLANIIYFFKT